MTPFQEWLGQIGLAHCSRLLVDNGIDFDVVPDLTDSDLHSLGLNLGDRRRLLRAIGKLAPLAAPANLAAAAADTAFRHVQSSPSERRQLTIMFCDLVGFTGLAQRLDPEELGGVIRAYHKACTHVVVQYDGYVAQYLGDGLMVYFGWPAAHEDDAERCVRAALEIVQAVKGVRQPDPLAVRIGIATGSVVVGEGSKEAYGEEGLAVGETPNLAARLQGLAGPDEVVIAPATRRLVGNTFEIADLGVHPLKGIVEPVRSWRVQSVLRTEGRFDAAHGGVALTALVGRDEEVALLVRHFNVARSGEGQAVLLSGEPGIGKSRLCQALQERIKGEPHTMLRYQCSPFRVNSALYPVIEHLEFVAGFAREDSPEQKLDKLEAKLIGSPAQLAATAPLFAELLSLPTDRYAPLGLSPQRRKEKLLDALVRQIEALARRQPVVMVFEDAHWTDPTSQELIDVLMPRLRAMRALFVLTYRPNYLPHGSEYAHVATMGLTVLPRHLGTELVEKVTQGQALPPDLIEQIVTRADGIPLFIEELTKSVMESRRLDEGGTRGTLPAAPTDNAIPTPLHALLIERLGRRGGVRELAQIGACIGREFSYELLAAVSPRKDQEFEEELKQLTETGLVFRRGEPPDATYTFKHALVQDAAYDSLLKSTRRQLHAQIARALETLFRERVSKEPELLARHHTEAGNLSTAIRLWREAGESALARVAFQEADGYLRNGLAILNRLPPSPDRDGLELSLREPRHSTLLRWHGWAAPDVCANATEILSLAGSQGKPHSLLIGLWGMWITTITQGRVAEAPEWAQRLLEQGRKDGNIDLTILGHRAKLSSHFYLGELRQAEEESKKVLALYDPAHAGRWMELVGNDVRTAVGVFTSQALWMLGFPDQAAAMSDQKDADARRLGHPFDIGWALTWGSYVFDYRCEPERLLERVREADRHGRDQSIPLFCNALVPIGEGLACLRLGQHPESIALLRRGIDGWTRSGGHLNMPYVKSALAEALVLQGDIDAGLHLIDECLDQIERPGWHERVWEAETLRLKGWMLMRQGKTAEAESLLRMSIDCAHRQEARSWELRSATTLAELLAERGQRERGAAREMLATIYDGFTEGFDTHDLKAARAMLESLR